MGSFRPRARKITPVQEHPFATAERDSGNAGRSESDRSSGTDVSSMLRYSGEVSLPSEIERLLLDVVVDGFVLYCCGPRATPQALVASYSWGDYIDLLNIRCFDRIITARVPTSPYDKVDVFNPEAVVWAYEGPPQPALRALLNLLPPHHPHAPINPYPAPPALHIPRAEQRPMTILFPPPERTRHRSARLAAMMVKRGMRVP
jgi:hypothetical protein